jgi:hypothetical protein
MIEALKFAKSNVENRENLSNNLPVLVKSVCSDYRY